MEKLTLTVAEAAQLLGISVSNMYPLTHIEGFPMLKLGRRKIIIPKHAFCRWLAEQTGDTYDPATWGDVSQIGRENPNA